MILLLSLYKNKFIWKCLNTSASTSRRNTIRTTSKCKSTSMSDPFVNASSAVKFKTSFKNCILDAFKKRGYKEIEK